MASVVILFVSILFELSESITNECSVSFNEELLRPSDMRLIGGYNDVLGPVQNLTYFDHGLILTSKMLYNGILRHPGGTVANYWSIKNASYTQPCNTSNYDNCYRQSVVEKLPPQTFSPSNFSKGIGTASPVIDPQNKYINSIVYDLNLLTLSDNDLLEQVQVLNEQIGAYNVGYIELGNEYYLNKYQYEFPNSTVYMNKAIPLINRIRAILPNTKISVCAQREHDINIKSEWNIQLNEFNKYYDSVTIHDYSCKQDLISNLSTNQQRSYIANYGQAIIPQIIQYVKHQFGDNKTIWMTEFNLNTIKNNSISYSVLHTMFIFSYVTAAICDTTKTMELLMLHLYATQIGNQWGIYDFVTSLSAKTNDIDGTTFDINGQLLAQLSYYSLLKNNHMTCLNFENTNNINTQCPKLGLNILGNNNLKCLFGAGFNNNKTGKENQFGLLIVNTCNYQISLQLNLNSFVGHNIDKEIMLQRYEYSYDMNGGINAKYVNCNNYENYNIWDASCAAVYAHFKNITIAKNSNTLPINISPLSVILALAE